MFGQSHFISIVPIIYLQDQFRGNLGTKNGFVINSDSITMCQGICSLYLGYVAPSFLNLNYCVCLVIVCVCVYVMPQCAHRGQQVTCGSPFSPSTI